LRSIAIEKKAKMLPHVMVPTCVNAVVGGSNWWMFPLASMT
jgi:hypothetical protein